MKKVKLFCLPHAGGSASMYLPWKKMITNNVVVEPIEYPGRGYRAKDPLCTTIDEIVQSVYETIVAKLDDMDEYMIFGHSMGSLIAYELAYKLVSTGCQKPSRIILSGGKAPQRRIKIKDSNKLPLKLFENVVLDYGGKQTEQIFRNEELMNYFIPILRADIKIVEEYLYQEPDYLLECDLSIFSGEEDESTQWDDIKEWSQVTTGSCQFFNFVGGHFFVQEQASKVLETINHIIKNHTTKNSVLN